MKFPGTVLRIFFWNNGVKNPGEIGCGQTGHLVACQKVRWSFPWVNKRKKMKLTQVGKFNEKISPALINNSLIVKPLKANDPWCGGQNQHQRSEKCGYVIDERVIRAWAKPQKCSLSSAADIGYRTEWYYEVISMAFLCSRSVSAKIHQKRQMYQLPTKHSLLIDRKMWNLLLLWISEPSQNILSLSYLEYGTMLRYN